MMFAVARQGAGDHGSTHAGQVGKIRGFIGGELVVLDPSVSVGAGNIGSIVMKPPPHGLKMKVSLHPVAVEERSRTEARGGE